MMRLRLLAVLATGFCLLHASSSQSINETLFEGESDDLFCEHSGSEEVAQFEWYLNGDQLLLEDAGMPDPVEESVVFSYLPVLGVEPEDEGTYTCIVRLVGGGTVGPTVIRHLTVLDPALVVAPPLQEALLGLPAMLQCDTALLAQYSPITQWRRTNGSLPLSPTFDSVQLAQEGTYICRVFLGTTESSTERSVDFRVIVPPLIHSQAPLSTNYTRNEPVMLSVSFQSRFSETTSVTWYKDSVQVPASAVSTASSDELNSTTALHFTPITRADRGLYRVVIQNTAAVIPDQLRQVETTFHVKVKVLPVAPVNLRTQVINSTLVKVLWRLTNQTADEGATELRLEVRTERQAPRIIIPSADAVEWNLVTVPGTEYEIILTALNSDGDTSVPAHNFATPPDSPSVLAVQAVRFNDTSFNLSATLSYTGGGDITHFSVSFRDTKELASEWIHHGAVSSDPSPHTNSLEWSGFVVNALLAELEMVEFNITVHNEMNFGTLLSRVPQILLPPGPPGIPTLTSSTPTSLTLSLELSHEGTAPILSVHLEITTATATLSNNSEDSESIESDATTPTPAATGTAAAAVNVTGLFQQGERVMFEDVRGLAVDTEYRIVAYAINEAGRSGYSEEALLRTGSIPLPIPVWAVILLAVVGSVVLTVMLFLSVFLCCRCYRHDDRTHKYSTGSNTPDSAVKTSTLESKHETGSVKHTGSFSQITARPLTPRSPTSSSRGPAYQDSPYLKPRFDTSSDSEMDSETTTSYPQYTYKLSASSPIAKETVHTKSLPILSIPTSNYDDISLDHDHLSPPLTASYATDV